MTVMNQIRHFNGRNVTNVVQNLETNNGCHVMQDVLTDIHKLEPVRPTCLDHITAVNITQNSSLSPQTRPRYIMGKPSP
jgi:hypothetical protein